MAPEVADVLVAAVDALAAVASRDRGGRPADRLAETAHLFEQLVWTRHVRVHREATWELSKAVAAAPVADDEPVLFRGGRATALRHKDWMVLDEARQHQRVAWAEPVPDGRLSCSARSSRSPPSPTRSTTTRWASSTARSPWAIGSCHTAS